MDVRGKEEQCSQEQMLFDDKLMVKIPASFKPMNTEIVQKKFPYNDRPQVILSDETGLNFCTFSLLLHPLSRKQIKPCIIEIGRVIASLYPASIITKPGTMSLHSTLYGWFAYQTATERGAGYNIMYVMSVDQNMMLGTCGCLLDDNSAIKTMKQIMQSIVVIDKRKRLR